MIADDRWEITMNKIGAGSFAEVLEGTDLKTNEPIAIKREPLSSKNLRLAHEYQIYSLVQGQLGFPKVYDIFDDDTHRMIIMERLGMNLKQLSKLYPNKKLPIEIGLELFIQALDRLKVVHEKGIVYRDMTPEQLCLPFKVNENEQSILHLIDFGLAYHYLTQQGNLEECTFKTFQDLRSGTARYASIAVHMGHRHSRKDDIESLIYVMIELMKGNLPWAGMTANTSQEGWRKIMDMKKSFPIEKLCESLPGCFVKSLYYVRSLHYSSKPDYHYLKSLFEIYLNHL